MDATASAYFSAGTSIKPDLIKKENISRRSISSLTESTNVNTGSSVNNTNVDFDEAVLSTARMHRWNNWKVTAFLQCVTLILTSDLENGGTEKIPIGALSCDCMSLSIDRSEVRQNFSFMYRSFDK